MDGNNNPEPRDELIVTSKPDLTVGFILMDKFTLYSVAGMVEPLRFAADVEFSSRQIFCQWEWMTWGNRPVTSSCGMPVSPTAPFDLNKNWDYVVLAGGLLEGTRDPPEALVKEIQALSARKVPIITLCSGSFIAARAGLLDGKRCAVHFSTRDEFKRRFPEVIPVIDRLYISEGGIISSPGGAPVELVVDIIRHHCGALRAQKVLKYLLAEEEKSKKSTSAAGTLNTHELIYDDELVRNAILFMKQHLQPSVSLAALAGTLQTSPRRLNNAFLRCTSDTAAVHWRKIRLEQARQLMLNSSLSIQEIASASGFSDASHLITWFRKHYGETPASFRKRRRDVERLHRQTE